MRRARLSLLFLVFMDMVGFSMLLPDVQLRAESLGAPGWLIGGILSSMFVVQTIVSPFWGALSDRVGRKPVVLVCTAISAAAMLLYTQSRSVWVILASRLLAGFGAANVPTAQAAVADLATPEERTARMGQVGAAISAGLIIGPAIGGFLAEKGGAVLLGLVAGSFSLAGLIAVAVWGPNPTPTHKRPVEGAGWSILRGRRMLTILFVIASVGWFSLACLEGTFGRLLERRLGEGQLAFGLIFAWESLLAVTVQALLLRRLADRFGERTLLLWAFGLQGAGLAAMPYAPSMAGMLVAATFFGIGNALLNPSINGWCSRMAAQDRQGAMFGLLQSTRSVGFMVGPVLGGALFDWQYASPYILSGVASLVAASIVVFGTRQDA